MAYLTRNYEQKHRSAFYKTIVSLIVFIWLIFPLPAYAGDVVRVILGEKVPRSEFSKAVGIDQHNFLWPITACPNIFSEVTKGIQRSRMELVIICNALKKSGFTGSHQLLPSSNAKRQKMELLKGEGDIIGHSVYVSALNSNPEFSFDSFFSTDILINRDQYIVGIYTTANQIDKVSSAFQNNQINTLIGTTVRSWEIDTITMQHLPIKWLHLVPSSKLIWRNLEKERANFTFANINKPKSDKGQTLIRVDGFYATLKDDRVLIVNKNKSGLYNIIQSYIQYLREDSDLVYKAFEHAGVFTEKYIDWKKIN